MPFYVYALMLHGVLGGVDVILNHELLAQLPKRPDAAAEERLHAAREFIFAALFAMLAWGVWHGPLAWLVALLLLGEVLVSARDVVVEGETRVLPVTERVLHLFLFMNLGALVVLVGGALLLWSALPAGVTRVDYGWASWLLSAMALGSLGAAVRDALSALRWRRAGQAA